MTGAVGGPVGAYPGTFDPPTVAHLAVAEAARDQGGLAAVHLVLSRAPLGKSPAVPSFEDRLAVLEEVAASRPWLSVTVTDRRLIAEVAAGYDAVVMGTDKWRQVMDPAWYPSKEERDRAAAGLPRILLARRGADPFPSDLPASALVLRVHEAHGPVSSTLVRAGRVEWMLPEAAAFDARTGAWSDPDRYGGDARGAGVAPTTLTPMPDPRRPRRR